MNDKKRREVFKKILFDVIGVSIVLRFFFFMKWEFKYLLMLLNDNILKWILCLLKYFNEIY